MNQGTQLGDTPPLFLRLFAIRQGIPFFVCLKETLETQGIVENFNRLYGASLGQAKSPIEMMIDQATGKCDSDMTKFIDFCWDSVFVTFGGDTKTLWPNPQEIPAMLEMMVEYLNREEKVQ